MYGRNFYEAYVEAMGRANVGIAEEWEDLSSEEQDAYDEAAQFVIDTYEASSSCDEEG